MLVVGAKEAENQTVSYRDRVDGDQGAMPLADALARLRPSAPAARAASGAPPPAAVPVEEESEDHTY